MVRIVLNDGHLGEVLCEPLRRCRHRLFIATANVKDLRLPVAGTTRRAPSFLHHLGELCARGVEVRLLHGGVPSGPLLERLKEQGCPPGLTLRRCIRMHAKVLVVDGRWMYLGSANLTGAGLGAKSPRRRNIEAGVWTDETELIDPVVDMLDAVWQGRWCTDCGRRDYCPLPLEEPQLR